MQLSTSSRGALLAASRGGRLLPRVAPVVLAAPAPASAVAAASTSSSPSSRRRWQPLHQQHQQHQHQRRSLVAAAAGGGGGGGGGGGSKSWADIAGDALNVAKEVAVKVADTAKGAIDAVVKTTTAGKGSGGGGDERLSPTGASRRSGGRRGEDGAELPTLLVPPGSGLMGRLFTGALNSAVRGLAATMADAAEQTRSVADDAARRIAGSAAVAARLGDGVRVGPPLSQSSMTSSVNGRTQRTVSLVLPVFDARGALAAQASVSHVEGSGGGGQQQQDVIVVRTLSGEAIRVDGGGSDGVLYGSGGKQQRQQQQQGEVIEAEYKDLN